MVGIHLRLDLVEELELNAQPNLSLTDPLSESGADGRLFSVSAKTQYSRNTAPALQAGMVRLGKMIEDPFIAERGEVGARRGPDQLCAVSLKAVN